MAEVTAALVKELREKTGAGMMDCKRALDAAAGEIEAAVDWLRKKGLAAAANKAGRVAAEGLIGVATRGPVGAVVEVNSETDFVARNQAFQGFVRGVSELALDGDGDGEIAALKEAAFPNSGRTVEAELTHLISTIGENLVLRRLKRLSTGQGAVVSYVHNALGPGIGKIGVIVVLSSTASGDRLAPLGKQLAMHIAAASPLYLDIASVPGSALDREREILEARAGGKPAGVVEKMVEGGIRKFYENVVLLEQISVIDQKTRISAVVEQAATAAGAPIEVTGFARFALGEGIDRHRPDFAAEVAAQLKN
jgi:elongation factor Ts